jgi:hypothetical protein
VTDHELRQVIEEYAQLTRRYSELNASSMALDRELRALRLPGQVESLEELREPLRRKANLEVALNTIRRQMRHVAEQQTRLAREIKQALPSDVTYRYNGYRVTKRAGDGALDFRCEPGKLERGDQAPWGADDTIPSQVPKGISTAGGA